MFATNLKTKNTKTNIILCVHTFKRNENNIQQESMTSSKLFCAEFCLFIKLDF